MSLDRILRAMAEKERLRDRGTWRAELRDRYEPWFDELAYGFEFKDGWRTLVEHTIEQIAVVVGGPQACPDIRITRLREKFGSLTCQIRNLPDDRRRAVDAVLRAAMEKSLQTCEWCGRPGRQRDDFVAQDYWTVECDEHAGQRRGGRGR